MREDATSEPGIPDLLILHALSLRYVPCPIGNRRLQGAPEDSCVQEVDDLYGISSHCPSCDPDKHRAFE